MVVVRDQYEVVNKAASTIAKIGISWLGIKTALIDTTKAALEQENADMRLAQAMRNAGVYSDALLKSFKAQATELQSTTNTADDYAESLQAQAVAMGVSVDKIDQVIRISLGLAKATGKDVAGAMTMVVRQVTTGRAEWSRYGIELDKTKDALPQLAERFEKLALTTGSHADQIKSMVLAYSDLEEEAGNLVLLGLDKLTGGFGRLKVALEGASGALAVGGIGNFILAALGGGSADPAVLRELQQAEELVKSLQEKQASIAGGSFPFGIVDSEALRAVTQQLNDAGDQLEAARAAFKADAVARGVISGGSGPPPPPTRAAGARPSAGTRSPKGKAGADTTDEAWAFAQQELDNLNAAEDEYVSAHKQRALDAAMAGINAATDEYTLRNNLAIANAELQDQLEQKTAQRRDQALRRYSDLAIGTFGSIAQTITMAAIQGGEGWQKMVGSQLMAQGTQAIWSGAIHGAMATAEFFLGNLGAAAAITAAGVEAALGATVLGIGAGMGGSLRGGGARGGAGARTPSIAPSSRAFGQSGRSETERTTNETIILNGVIIDQDRAMQRIADTRRNGIGYRAGMVPRRAFA